ncbi:MAG: DUF3783 domain-containing protein [Oscillibacter sp.]|nr:DUF3783 domain-containing protein [Oscillibacter sp.]
MERMAADESGKKVLLFSFEDLREILAVKTALDAFGAELIPVGKADYGKKLAVLAGLEEPEVGSTKAEWETGAAVGRMALLCGLREHLDQILPALSSAGAGQNCLKAVLTESNRAWTPVRLYGELSEEQRAMREAQKRQGA